MSFAILVLLVEAAVFATVIYVAVRFGVRDGMADFEKRKRDGSGDPSR
jgi:hypothetical protein